MSLVIVTPPAALPVSEEEAWAHLQLTLRPTGSPETMAPRDREHVERLIRSAVDLLDGPNGAIGSRCMIQQTWKLRLCDFPADGVIRLPLAPVQSVTHFFIVDPSGASVPWSNTNYTVSGLNDPNKQAEIMPAPGASWPAIRKGPESIQINFVAGFGASPESVPASLKLAVLETVRQLYEAHISALPFSGLSDGVREALRPFRRWTW